MTELSPARRARWKHPDEFGRDNPQSGADELDIGPRVTAVFTAAERAAQHIVEMAREEAEDVRRRAQAEVETLLSQRRYEAEEEASRLLAEARVQADAIRATADEEARQRGGGETVRASGPRGDPPARGAGRMGA